ncbi:MAG TPA: TonB-dependent receptor [Candidatus Kapabacteria bacterium]|nr:TonB-dependent receptor [Candidatus Kapabacteria bacterium]HPO61463.1 TonB-dependent receptor [Candidatus Kapabacteria bacterium]
MKTKNYIYLLVLICFVLNAKFLQGTEAIPTKEDSIRVYKIGEVVITDSKLEKLSPSKMDIVNYFRINRIDATSFTELTQVIPSTKVRTNSRGESMLYIRGASERQLGLFFDGVQMNIPWDNRMDLTFVPTDMIGQVVIDKQSSSILYGPNVLGGAVSINTQERSSEGIGLNLKIQGNDANSKMYSVCNDGRFGNFNYIANVSYLKSDGFLMSKDAPDVLNNQNIGSRIRTNTDQKRLNAYLRGEMKFDENTIVGLSFSYTNQEKGVGANTDTINGPRYWRYPDRNRFLTTLNAWHSFDNNKTWQLRGTLWFDAFDQKIEDFKDFTYTELNSTQKDEDKTFGGRIILDFTPVENHTISYVLNAFSTNHDEQIDNDEKTKFEQITLSTGLEYKGKYDLLSYSLGAVLDYNKTPKTGIFTDYEGNSSTDLGACLSVKYDASKNFAVFGELSRRTRFATMREQFSGALKKFKVNPDLKPETGILAELGVVYELDNVYIKLSGFANFYDDLIVQKTLPKTEDSLKRKIRYNLADAKIYGAELNLFWNPISTINLEGYFTYMSSKGEENGKEYEHLSNKPDFISTINVNYKFDFGLKLLAEADLTGKQYEEVGVFQEIDASTVFNFRASYQFFPINNIQTEIFARVNNITDEFRYSQFGFPEPGRMVTFGISLMY